MTLSDVPKTVEEAIDHLIEKLPLHTKTKIAKMDKSDLTVLHITIGPHIRDEFELWKGNDELLESCRILRGQDQLRTDAVSSIIIDLLWARLRRTHSVRVVKWKGFFWLIVSTCQPPELFIKARWTKSRDLCLGFWFQEVIPENSDTIEIHTLNFLWVYYDCCHHAL